MTLPGADSATPKPASYPGKRIWGVYVAGSAFKIWSHQDVAELGKWGIEGVMPIVVPPQDEEWWLENNGYAVLEALVREAKAWGVPEGSPLCLDVEQHQADAMSAKSDVAHAWAVATRTHKYRTWTYSGRSYLLADMWGFRWVADWPEPTPTDPQIPQGFNAWQYATDTAKGIDLDIFEAGRDYMTPDLKVVVLQEPSVKEHISEPVASSSKQPPDSTGNPTADDSVQPVTEAGGERADTPQTPPAEPLHERFGAAIDKLNDLWLEFFHRETGS